MWKTHGTVDEQSRLDSYSPHIALIFDTRKAIENNQGAGQKALTVNRTQNNYGGRERIYFKCPECGKNTRYLYRIRTGAGCRVCAKLNYKSQQISHGRKEAEYRLERFLQKKFGVTGKGFGHILNTTPPRPKKMHKATYSKLIARLRHLQLNLYFSRTS